MTRVEDNTPATVRAQLTAICWQGIVVWHLWLSRRVYHRGRAAAGARRYVRATGAMIRATRALPSGWDGTGWPAGWPGAVEGLKAGALEAYCTRCFHLYEHAAQPGCPAGQFHTWALRVPGARA